MSAVFDFNASLNDCTPLSSTSLPIHLIRTKKLLICAICRLFLLVFTTQIEFQK